MKDKKGFYFKNTPVAKKQPAYQINNVGGPSRT